MTAQNTDAVRHLSLQVQALKDQADELLRENAAVRSIGIQLRRELAWQVDLVEKCMVAMNENADKGQAAEAKCKTLTEQLELERGTVLALSEQLESVRADAPKLIEFIPLPLHIYQHDTLKEMYDRHQMHSYAIRYAMACGVTEVKAEALKAGGAA